jgi:hypothetical protein
MLDRNHEARDQGGGDGRRQRETVVVWPGSGDTGVGDGTDMCCLRVSGKRLRERERGVTGGRRKSKEKVYLTMAPRARRPAGQRRSRRAMEGERAEFQERFK